MSTPDLEARLRDELGAAADRIASDTRFPAPLRERVHRRRRRHVLAARAGMVGIAVAVVGVAVVAGPSQEPESIAPAGATDRIDDPADLSFVADALPPSPLSARVDPSAVWTGRELIVWGGSLGRQALADGAAYDPATGTWRVLAAAPIPARARHAAVWTGTEMIVAGGSAGPSGVGDLLEAAAYDPATDTWRPLPALPAERQLGEAAFVAGRVVIGDGGSSQGQHPPTLLVLDPAGSAWEIIDVGAPVTSVAAAGDRIVVTTQAYMPTSSQAAVALVDPVTGAVEAAPSLGEVSALRAGTAVWTGERVVAAVVDDADTHLLAWAPGEAAWTPAATVSSDGFSPDFHGIDPGAARWIDGWIVSRPLGGLLEAAAPGSGDTVDVDFDPAACGGSAAVAFADDDAYYVVGGRNCDADDPANAGGAVATGQRVRIVSE